MGRRQKELLVVDGYNIINAWEELKEIAEINLENARDRLNLIIAEYLEYRGIKGYIIYDAYRVKTLMNREEKLKSLTIIYTKEKQTADSYIEKFINDFEDKRNTIIRVATDDVAEQNMVIGKGASRLSTLELHLEIKASQKKIKDRINHRDSKKNTLYTVLDDDTLAKLEQMRRGN